MGCRLWAVGLVSFFFFFFFFFFVLRNLQPTAYSPQPVTRYRPGGGQGVGNGNADAQAALVKLAQHALGQGRFASFQPPMPVTSTSRLCGSGPSSKATDGPNR